MREPAVHNMFFQQYVDGSQLYIYVFLFQADGYQFASPTLALHGIFEFMVINDQLLSTILYQRNMPEWDILRYNLVKI